MTPDSSQLEAILASMPERPLHSVLSDLSHTYWRAATELEKLSGKAPTFAPPAIMIKAFSVELLLKFFLAIEHPTKTVDELKAAGVKLRYHEYSKLFDQISQSRKEKIAVHYADLSGKPSNANDFRTKLLAQGDDPFVYWRYVYETSGISTIDWAAFELVVVALGRAAAEATEEVAKRNAVQNA